MIKSTSPSFWYMSITWDLSSKHSYVRRQGGIRMLLGVTYIMTIIIKTNTNSFRWCCTLNVTLHKCILILWVAFTLFE